jgi:hypothetical protein
MTNREFVKDKFFVRCCERAGVTPTPRQASKFRNDKGRAIKVKLQVAKEDKNEEK